MRKELARKVKYEYVLSLAETGRQLAVTNNDVSFIVFTEQRP